MTSLTKIAIDPFMDVHHNQGHSNFAVLKLIFP
jgi:hypothetical protein